MRRHYLFVCLGWMFVALIRPPLAWSQGAGGSSSPPPALEVRWILDSVQGGNLGGVHFELTGKYEIRQVHLLKWVGGSLDKSDARFESERAVFRYVSPEEQMGNASREVVSARMDDAGEIRQTPDGNAEIELDVTPAWKGVSGPYDEATGCVGFVAGGGYWNPIQLSQADLRRLRSEKLTLRAPERETVPGCTSSLRVEITMPTIELKYDQTSVDVAQLRYPCGVPIDSHVYVSVGPTERDAQAGSWVPHANFAGEVWVNGRNEVHIDPTIPPCPAPDTHPVTSDYRIRRIARSWKMNGSGSPVTKDQSNEPLTPPWHADNHGPGDGQEWAQDWIDNAAVGFLPPPDKWPSRGGVLDEFLVSVQDRPECGCIYTAYAMEIERNPKRTNWVVAYRIKYSQPEVIDKKEWDARRQNQAPNVDLQFAGDEGWVYLGRINGKWSVLK